MHQPFVACRELMPSLRGKPSSPRPNNSSKNSAHIIVFCHTEVSTHTDSPSSSVVPGAWVHLYLSLSDDTRTRRTLHQISPLGKQCPSSWFHFGSWANQCGTMTMPHRSGSSSNTPNLLADLPSILQVKNWEIEKIPYYGTVIFIYIGVYSVSSDHSLWT